MMVVLPTKEDKVIALHDVDKHLDDRSNPTPNADDKVQNPMAHETTGTTYRTAGSGVNQSIVFQQGAIEAYDQTNVRNAFFGYAPEINPTRPILRVTKENVSTDVLNATDSQLAFNSENNVFKIVESGTSQTAACALTSAGAGNWSSASSSVTIPHNLGYIPAIFAFYNSGGGSYVPLPFTQLDFNTSTSVAWFVLSAIADNTNLYLQVNAMGLNRTATFVATDIKYYLLQETAN